MKAVNLLYGPLMIFDKIAVLSTYCRLLSPSTKLKRWFYIGIGAAVFNLTIDAILSVTLCRASFATAHCSINLDLLDLTASVVHLAADFYILLLLLFAFLYQSYGGSRTSTHLFFTPEYRKNFLTREAVGWHIYSAYSLSISGLVYNIMHWNNKDWSW